MMNLPHNRQSQRVQTLAFFSASTEDKHAEWGAKENEVKKGEDHISQENFQLQSL